MTALRSIAIVGGGLAGLAAANAGWNQPPTVPAIE